MRLLRTRGSVEIRKIVSGSATQGFQLKNRKVGSRVSGADRSRLSGKRAEYTDLGFDLSEREEQVVCYASALALAMTDKAR